MSDERITRGESGSHTLKYKKVSVRVLVCVAKRQHQRKKFDFEQICATSKKIRKEQDSAPDLWGGSCGFVVPEERSLGSSPVRGVDIFCCCRQPCSCMC